jgi:methylated-DNA-protein-cysteine methyltransferase-like protein
VISTAYRRIYRVIARIPRGRVATYGLVARLAGFPGHARLVGYALRALPGETHLPWHRVLNARGAISLPDATGAARYQRFLLEREGVRFDVSGRVNLPRFAWRPRPPRPQPPGGHPC